MILTADWHLVDTLSEEYRWRVFDELLFYSNQLQEDKEVFILGDLTDRKDRHSAELVNRLCAEFVKLLKLGFTINIICGNHDMPLNGPPFWTFLNLIDDKLMFHIKPFVYKDVLLLPYSTKPNEDWADLLKDVTDYNAIFMHQPVRGAMMESGRAYETEEVINFPRNVQVWSGDVHTPQQIGQVRYVGAPHPIKFGDTYKCRMIQLDKRYNLIDEHAVATIQKLVLDISSVEELQKIKVRKYAQVKIRFQIDATQIAAWPVEREAITSWALHKNIVLHSIEPSIILGERNVTKHVVLANNPVNILDDFATKEALGEKILEIGQRMLSKVLSK